MAHRRGSVVMTQRMQQVAAVKQGLEKQKAKLDEEAEEGQLQKKVATLVLMAAFPICSALRGAGVAWSSRQSTFSVSLVPALGSAIICLGLCCVLSYRYGCQELKLLLGKDSLKLVALSLVDGLANSLEAYAYVLAEPSVCSAVLQTIMLFNVLLRLWRRPSEITRVQVLSVLGAAMSALAYANRVGSDEEESEASEGQNTLLGVFVALASAFLLSCSVEGFSAITSEAMEAAEEAGEEELDKVELRSLAANTAGTAIGCGLYLVATDLEFVMEHGLFGGWSIPMALLTVLPFTIVDQVEMRLVLAVGPVFTSLLETLEVICIYFISLFLLGGPRDTPLDLLQLSHLVVCCCLYNICVAEAQQAALQAQHEQLQMLNEALDSVHTKPVTAA